MKEVVAIEEVSTAVDEDIKKLEDTMAVEGIAPMVKRSMVECDESMSDEVIAAMRGVEIAPSEPLSVLEELATEVEIEGMGRVAIPIDPPHNGKIYTETYVKTPAVATKNRVFDSGLKVIKTHTEKVSISVAPIIINVCNNLQKKVGNNEFSIVCKGHWNDDGLYVVGDEYEVPKQKVDGAAVDYDLNHLEELKMQGFNTVIHSHPFKSSNFSHSDDTTINSHFECSVLYSVGEFTTATIAVIPIPGTKLIVTGNPFVEGMENIVPASKSNNIEQKYKHDYKYVNYNNYYNDNWYGNKTRNSKLIGSDPEDCEMEYDKYNKNKSDLDKFRGDEFGQGIYHYDEKDDVLYKNGKPIHSVVSARMSAARSSGNQPIKVHQSEIPNRNVARVFKTTTDEVHADQKTSGVFTVDNKRSKSNRVSRK